MNIDRAVFAFAGVMILASVVLVYPLSSASTCCSPA